MGDSLANLLGLGDPAPAQPSSETQAEARAAFGDALGPVNESLQQAVAAAPPEAHAALSGDRDKLIEAYQVASSQFGGDESSAQAAMDRVLAAAQTLSGKAAQTAQAAAAAQQTWQAKEASFDDMALQVAELQDAGHPKSDTLKQVCDTIRAKAHGACYADSSAAVDELGPKLQAMMAEHQALIEAAKVAAGVKEKEQSGSWWDSATDAVKDAYDWVTGDDKPPSDQAEGTSRKSPDAPAEDNEAPTGDPEQGERQDDDKEAQDGDESDPVIGSNTGPLSVTVNITCTSPEPVYAYLGRYDPPEPKVQKKKELSPRPSGGLISTTFSKLPKGTYTVSVSQPPLYLVNNVTLAESNQTVGFDLTAKMAAIDVEVEFVGLSKNRPAAGVAVRCDEVSRGAGPTVSTNDRGKARIPVMPGAYRVTAMYGQATSTDEVIVRESQTRTAQLQLSTAATLYVEVDSADGQAAKGAEVHLYVGGQMRMGSGTSDGGVASFAGIEPGEYQVLARPAEGGTWTWGPTVNLKEGDMNRVSVRLP